MTWRCPYCARRFENRQVAVAHALDCATSDARWTDVDDGPRHTDEDYDLAVAVPHRAVMQRGSGWLKRSRIFEDDA